MRKHLTDAFVKSVPLPNKHKGAKQQRYIQKIERGLSLVLVVSYQGTKSFNVLTYKDGQPKTYKIGQFPDMTCKVARQRAEAFRADPDTIRAQDGKAKEPAETFKAIAENWLKRHVEHRKLISRPEIERHLSRYVYDYGKPKWRDRKFTDIRRKEVNALLDHIVDKHGAGQADAVLATIRGIMGWYQTRDDDYMSPIVKGMKRKQNKARSRKLTDDEIRKVWKLDGHRFHDILKLLMLTAQRREKIASMKWSDLKDGIWSIPEEKDGKPKGTIGKVRLPQAAADIIDRQPMLHGSPYIFAGRNGAWFNDWEHCKLKVDEEVGFSDWVIHDLRRTARSLMSRAGIQPHISERVLGHVQQGVEGTYDRHEYTDEKSQALQALANLIQSIVDPPPANVVPLPKKSKSLMTG